MAPIRQFLVNFPRPLCYLFRCDLSASKIQARITRHFFSNMSDVSLPPPAAMPTEGTPVGTPASLPPSFIAEPHLLRSATVPASVPMSAKRLQRSFGPLFKAYAFALRAKISGGASDMSSDDQAFFTSTSMQRGVPMKMDDAYTNARVFSLADCIQSDRSPTLSESERSFVRYLER